MGWLIFWGVVAAYWAIGIRRYPVYYRRWYDASKKEWTYRSEGEHQKSAMWTALGVATVWPYYEAGRWFRDTVIMHMTAEERAKAEFEKAERIVAEYTERREREARADFDRKMKE